MRAIIASLVIVAAGCGGVAEIEGVEPTHTCPDGYVLGARTVVESQSTVAVDGSGSIGIATFSYKIPWCLEEE